MRGVLAGLALLLLPLAAGEQAVPPAFTVVVDPPVVATTLYFHPVDIQDLPINLQVPQYRPWDGDDAGVSASTLHCLDPTMNPVTGGTTSQVFHTTYGYSSASYVEYDYPSADGHPRTHPERPLAYDIVLDGDAAALHWFVTSTNGVGEGPDGNDMAPMTNVVLRASVRAGDNVSADGMTYDEGPEIMAGRTEPVTLVQDQVTGAGAGAVTTSQVDGRWVYEFTVPLQYQVDRILRAVGFSARIDLYMDNPACTEDQVEDEQYIMPGVAELVADAQHQPRIELRNAEPLRVKHAGARPGPNDTVELGWSVISAWGAYDVLANGTTVQVSGPSAAVAEPSYTIQRIHEHYHLTDPVQQGWTLDVSSLDDGAYQATISTQNLQRSATATATVEFEVREGALVQGPAEDAPGLGLAVVGLAVLLVVVMRRRD